MTRQSGFTLVELLLTLTIMILIVGLSLPVYASFGQRNDLGLTTQTVVDAVRRAEAYSRGNNGDSVWGVEFLASGVTLFKGTTYASRATGSDEFIALPNSVSLSGTSELTFAKLTGYPNTTGTVTLTSTTNDTRQISVNAKGMVDY